MDKNRTRGAVKSVYIAGGIDRLSPEEVIKRFNFIQYYLEGLGVNAMSPVRGKKTSSTDVDFMPYEPSEVVDRDLNDVRRADLVFAVMPKPSIGTSMEIALARHLYRIPVIVITEDPAVYKHYWIRRHASKILPTIDEGLKYLREWYL